MLMILFRESDVLCFCRRIAEKTKYPKTVKKAGETHTLVASLWIRCTKLFVKIFLKGLVDSLSEFIKSV